MPKHQNKSFNRNIKLRDSSRSGKSFVSFYDEGFKKSYGSRKVFGEHSFNKVPLELGAIPNVIVVRSKTSSKASGKIIASRIENKSKISGKIVGFRLRDIKYSQGSRSIFTIKNPSLKMK